MIRNLETMFPEMSACKTRAGAQKRIDRMIRDCEQALPPTGRTVMITTIVERPDGRFVPVAIIGDTAGWTARTITEYNVGVTNVA